MTVIVLAGTPVDTQMGVDLVERAGGRAIGLPVSANPHEQNELQYLDRAALFSLVVAKVEEGIAAGGDRLLIYCNSLSTAIDIDRLRQICQIPVVTPLQVYRRWARAYERLALISANSQAASGIETILLGANPSLSVLSIGLLPVVEAIEQGIAPRQIVEDFRLAELIAWFGSQADPNLRPQAVVLGCTHFPYLREELLASIDIPALDPSSEMVAELVNAELVNNA